MTFIDYLLAFNVKNFFQPIEPEFTRIQRGEKLEDILYFMFILTLKLIFSI